MEYPSLLLQKNRKKKDSSRIRNWNYLYSRHKPSSNWNTDEGLPDFTQIKIDQSFNWCNYSIPIWTRFNDKQKYSASYAVAGFHVGTIRNNHQKLKSFDSQAVTIQHKPIETNYSHCELKAPKTLTKTERRELRATFRHNCKVPLHPNQNRVPPLILTDILLMYLRRFLSGNI